MPMSTALQTLLHDNELAALEFPLDDPPATALDVDDIASAAMEGVPACPAREEQWNGIRR